MKIKRKPKKKVVMSFGIQSLKKNKGKIGVSKQFKLKVPSYLTSHSRPHSLRKFVANKKRLNRMDKSSVIPSLMIGKPKYISKKNLSWPQAKRRYPLMNPYRDTDRDGVKNIFDCRPFDKKKQGWAHEGHTFNREETTHVRMMSPEKFLRTTRVEAHTRNMRNLKDPYASPGTMAASANQEDYEKSVLNKENIEKLKKVIRSSKGKMEVPYLLYDKQGRPTGHEGRHRAKAAEEQGVKLIPVTIGRKLKGDDYRDWEDTRERGGAKKDWKKELEHEEEVISSKSADIPIQQQREYGESKPEVLKDYEEVEEIVEDETYDVDDSDDKTLDYKEEEETKEEEDD